MVQLLYLIGFNSLIKISTERVLISLHTSLHYYHIKIFMTKSGHMIMLSVRYTNFNGQGKWACSFYFIGRFKVEGFE